MKLADENIETKWVRLERAKPSPYFYDFVKTSGAVEAMWEWLPRLPGRGTNYDSYYDYVAQQIEKGKIIALIAYNPKNNDFVGGAAYLRESRTHRSVQIGYTWITPAYRGTSMTLAIQCAMLERAYERGARRVFWMADTSNSRMVGFLESKIGAVREGVLRCFTRMNDGHWCDAAIYALVGDEISDAIRRLNMKLDSRD